MEPPVLGVGNLNVMAHRAASTDRQAEPVTAWTAAAAAPQPPDSPSGTIEQPSLDSSTQPLSALWRPSALMAVLLGGEALALILALAPAQPAEGRLVQFGLASLGIQWVALGTLYALYLLRHRLVGWPPKRIAWLCLALLLAMTALVSAAAWGVLSMAGEWPLPRWTFMLRMLALALVVGLIGLLTFQNYWEARRLAVRTKQLELEALQARIRPHFLFNTLNTGAALVHARPDEAERVLLDLADLFRSALRGPQRIPLAEELDLTRRYLDIEALRLGDRLRLQWSTQASVPEVLVPSLSIQPLAENAIRHGIERRPKGGMLEIAVTSDRDFVRITIANDLPEAGAAARGHAVGLASARERVDALTRGLGKIESGVEDGRYTARMTLPLGSDA